MTLITVHMWNGLETTKLSLAENCWIYPKTKNMIFEMIRIDQLNCRLKVNSTKYTFLFTVNSKTSMFLRRVLPILMAGVLLLSSITSLTTVVASSKPIESVKELHEVVVRNGFTTLDAQGQIVINTNAKEIGVSGELFEQICQ